MIDIFIDASNNFASFPFYVPQHTDPDYSCVYVTIHTAEGIRGYGMTFTLGKVETTLARNLVLSHESLVCRSRNGYRLDGGESNETIR